MTDRGTFANMTLEEKIKQLELIIGTVEADRKRVESDFEQALEKQDGDKEAYGHYMSLMALEHERSYLYEEMWKLMDQQIPLKLKGKVKLDGGRHFSRKSNARHRKTVRSR